MGQNQEAKENKATIFANNICGARLLNSEFLPVSALSDMYL